MSHLDPYACGGSCSCGQCRPKDPCDEKRPLEVIVTNGPPQAEPDPCTQLPVAFDAATGCFYLWSRNSGWFQADGVEVEHINSDPSGNGDTWRVRVCEQTITIYNSRNTAMRLEHRPGGGDNDGQEFLVIEQTHGPAVEVNLSDLDSYVTGASYNPNTQQLTLNQSQGKPPVVIDLSALPDAQTQVRPMGAANDAQRHTFVADHFGTYPNTMWRETWMERNGDIVVIHSWNPQENSWDEVAIEAPENLVVLNNPVIYLRETGSANPPIETQDDLTVANAFNSMAAIRNFLNRSLVVGTVTVDGRGSYEGGTGNVGANTFKNAQNIVVRGDPDDPSALEFKRTNVTGSVAVAAGGGNVTFRDMTVRVDTAAGAVTGSVVPRNFMLVANNDTALSLAGTVRLVGTGNTDHYDGGRLYGYGAQNRGTISVGGAQLEVAMAAAHKFAAFIYAADGGTVGFGGNADLALQTTLIANNFIRIAQESTFNGNSFPSPPPVISGAGQLDVTNVFSVQNLAFIKYSSWDPIAGPGSGWPTVAPVTHDIGDYSVWNGTMGMDL